MAEYYRAPSMVEDSGPEIDSLVAQSIELDRGAFRLLLLGDVLDSTIA